MKDNRTLEQKIRSILSEESDLYYGSDKARDTYAKDTPGQTPGHDHNPDFQKHDKDVAVDGVPVKGGEILKPRLDAVKSGGSMNLDVNQKIMEEVEAEIDALAEVVKMTPAQRKVAAQKIFQMRQASNAQKALSTSKGKSDPAAKAAKRDSASYKTSDDSHLDAKPKAEPKRGRGEKDLPHIVSQLRGVVDTKDGKPSQVKFKDGTTKNVKPKHAASWLKKHDSAKPADKMGMYKSHDSHSTFKSMAKEAVNADDKPGLEKLSKQLKGSVKAHADQKKALDTLIKNEAKVKNCGCGKDPCETYGSKEEQMKEARAWDSSSKGRAYRRLSDVEKKRLAKKNALVRTAKAMKGDQDYVRSGSMRKPTLGSAKSVYRGSKTRSEALISHLAAVQEEKMAGSEYRQQIAKHGDMDKSLKKAVTSVYDKKAASSDYDSHPEVKKAKRYMKIGEAVEKMNESSSSMDRMADTWNDHADHKHPTVQKHIKKAKKAYDGGDHESFHNHTQMAADAAYKVRKEEMDNIQELSPELVKKVAHKRNVNVSMAGSKADYDRRDPDYQKAAEKQHKNQMLRFGRGAKTAKKIGNALSKSINK